MAAPEIRMVVVDIDGTLLPSAGTRVSERSCRALRAAEAAGIEIVVATGRRQSYAAPLLEPIGLKPETVLISSNGTVTRTLSGEAIDLVLLPVETARRLAPALRPWGTMVFTFDREGPGALVVESLETLHERVRLWVEANRPWICEVRPLERAFDKGDAPVQGMVCGTVAEMRRAEEWLRSSEIAREVAVHRTEYPARDLTILDILAPGCSKGSALERHAGKRGVKREEILAMGDNWNDLEMLQFAGRAAVMRNGAPDFVAQAVERGWEVVPGNDEDGVAQALEKLAETAAMSIDATPPKG